MVFCQLFTPGCAITEVSGADGNRLLSYRHLAGFSGGCFQAEVVHGNCSRRVGCSWTNIRTRVGYLTRW